MQQAMMLDMDSAGPIDSRPAPVRQVEADIQTAYALYNETAARCGLPKAEEGRIAEHRHKKLKKRLEHGGLANWRIALDTIERSRFLRGVAGGRGWKASLDFMLQPDKYQKLLERAYDQDFGGSEAATRSTAAAGAGRVPTEPAGPLDKLREATRAELMMMADLPCFSSRHVTDRQMAWVRHQVALKAAGKRYRWSLIPAAGWEPAPASPPEEPPPPAEIEDYN